MNFLNRFPKPYLGKGSIIIGFILFLVGILFWVPERHWVSSLTLTLAAFFLTLGWIVETEQLFGVPLLGKIGVLMIFVSTMSLTLAAVSSIYCEIGMFRHEISVEILGFSRWRLVPTVKWVRIHPYAWLSPPLAAIGLFLLISGSALKIRYDYVVEERYQLIHRKNFAIGLTILLVGISFLLFGGVCHGYIDVYERFMSSEVRVPPAYGYATIYGATAQPGGKPPLLYIDLVFSPWFNCHLENSISSHSSRKVTLTVFIDNVSEPIINLTTNEIKYSLNLQANTQYVFRIRNTVNRTVAIAMSTKINDSISQKAILLGVPLTIVGLVITIKFSEIRVIEKGET